MSFSKPETTKMPPMTIRNSGYRLFLNFRKQSFKFGLQRLHADDHLPVHVIRRSAFDPALFTLQMALLNKGVNGFIVETRAQFIFIKGDLLSNKRKGRSRVHQAAPIGLTREQRVMEWPEFPLPGGAFSIAGRQKTMPVTG